MASTASSTELARQEERFRSIFHATHHGHPGCLADEWLVRPCADAQGEPVARPVVWSRRNGPWRRVRVLWVGAAPGNAGGRGGGDMGAHATRIPFGGDIAGANLDVLFGSIGLERNRTFVVAALNQLPAAGGGEPSRVELSAPVGGYPSSLHLLRDTLLASGPELVVALGNVAARALIAAARLAGPTAWEDAGASAAPAGRTGSRNGARQAQEALRLPGVGRLRGAGLERNRAVPWPAAEPPSAAVLRAWRTAWGDASCPHVLWLTHPSAQNMSPYAGVDTAFHTRMLEAKAALAGASSALLGERLPSSRPKPPTEGIYALPEWRERVGPRHAELDRLWREKGV